MRRSRTLLGATVISGAALGLTTLTPFTGVAYAATFGAPVVVSSADDSEPGVDVAPDGTLYVNAPVGVLASVPGSPSDVFRSSDGGATWTKLPASLKANLPGGGDSDIAISADGSLAETDLWLGNSTVATSTDKGQTWLANPLQGVFGQDRQWVAATSGGRVYHVVHQIPTGLWVSRSVDGGLTYPQHVLAAHVLNQTGCICPPGNIVAEDGGLTGDKVGGVYATSTGGVGFYRSVNGGLTFSNNLPGPASSATTDAAFPVVADNGSGGLAVVWLAISGNTSSVLFTTSSDFGATWATPKTIVSGGANVYPWVAYRGSRVVVSLFHSTTSGTPDSVGSAAKWFESFLDSADNGATWSALATVDATAVKSGPVCTQGIDCSSDRQLGDFQQIALDNAGKAVMTYVHVISGNNTEIRFVHEA
jgi:hypothetical protein